MRSFDQSMVETLARNWWMLLIRGLVALLFGILAFIYPGAALLALVLLYGAYAFVDGIFAIIAAVNQGERRQPWGFLLLSGIVSIIAGIVTAFYPGITALVLVTIMGIWAVLRGVLEIAAAVQLRRVIRYEWALALGGVLSILFGVLLFVFPGAGLLAVVWLVAGYAIIYGVMAIVFSIRVHHYGTPVTLSR